MIPDSPANPPEYVAERNAALLSLDEGRIIAMMEKWGVRHLYSCDEAFWCAIHKTRTVIDLPLEARLLSHRWLTERGFTSFLPTKLIPKP